MPAVARLGDTSDHGGVIISASGNVKVNGIGIAREGDMHSCPLPGHGVTALISGSKNNANGRKIIRIGDTAGCGAVIVSGSSNVNSL